VAACSFSSIVVAAINAGCLLQRVFCFILTLWQSQSQARTDMQLGNGIYIKNGFWQKTTLCFTVLHGKIYILLLWRLNIDESSQNKFSAARQKNEL
jgi:hypothetical protein